METASLVGLEVKFKGTTYFFVGEYREEKTILTTKVQEVEVLLMDLLGANNTFYNFVRPLMPNEIEFVYTINKFSKNSFSLRASFGDNLIELQIIKASKFALVELWVNQPLPINSLPLVGEFIPNNYQITGIGYVYLEKIGPNISLTAADFASFNFERIRSSVGNELHLVLNESHNVFIKYKFNTAMGILAYPMETLSIDSPNNQTNSIISNSNEFLITSQNTEVIDKKNFGIDKLKLQLDKNRKLLQLYIAAHLYLSKFQLEVLGLKINYSLMTLLDIIGQLAQSSENINWKEEVIKGLSYEVDGLSIRHQTPQFSIYGGFYKQHTDTGTAYNGLITFKFKKVEVVALGSYIEQTHYNSVYGFGYVGAPFGGIPAFELKGIALAFGLNRSFQFPSIQQVEQFPLIKVVRNNGLRRNQTLADFFNEINTYFQPKQDAYVITLGIRLETFKIMDTIALASVVIDQGCKLNIIGVSTLTSSQAYKIIIPFLLTIDLEAGEIIARGEIANGSYILFPELSLTGSFALGMWFAGSQAGDFVITLGGYHPAFRPKEYYPSAADLNRLSLQYRKGNLNIYGGLYFTLTAQAIMCGIIGQIYYNYNFGITIRIGGRSFGFQIAVEILIQLESHFIISWKPFYYSVELHLLFSISLRANFTLFKVNISTQIAAGLHLWGPEFSGRAYLTVCSYQLSVKFGSGNQRKTQLSKAEFVQTYLPNAPIDSSILSGIIEKQSASNTLEIQYVNAQDFVLEINSKIPIKQLQHKGLTIQTSTSQFDANYDKSQHAESLQSNLSLKITNEQGQDILLDQAWEVNPLYGNYPKALWCQGELTTQSILKEENLIKHCISGAQVKFKLLSPLPTNGQIILATETFTKKCEMDVAKNIQLSSITKNSSALAFQFQQSLLDSFVDVDIDFNDLRASIASYTYNHPIHVYDLI